jgi:hypothetical protein
MKHIRTFESFRNKNKENKINEELLGGLFKSLKNKMSLGFSKMFGSAKEADKLFEQYKSEILAAMNQKFDMTKQFLKFVKDTINSGEVDETKKNDFISKLQQAKKLFEEKKDIIKKKFDLRIGEVVKNEKNPKIKNYIELKKLELAEEMINKEIELISTELKPEDLEKVEKIDKEIASALGITEKEQQAKKIEELKDKTTQDLNKSSEESGESTGFDFEKAKQDKEYNWVESKFSKEEYKFETGEEIKFWSNKKFEEEGGEYAGTTAFVFEPQEGDDTKNIRVGYEKDNKEGTFSISKGKVISTTKDEESKKAEEEKNQQAQAQKATTEEGEAGV